VDPHQKFKKEVADNVSRMGRDDKLRELSLKWSEAGAPYGYTYNFSWLGVPIIQLPPDIVAMQELIWQTRPELVIETGVAHGGSLVMSASMLALLDYCDAREEGRTLDPARPHRKVLGIDIDIRSHNRAAIEAHPMSNRIEMIQGSSIAQEVVAAVRSRAEGHSVLVCLDSDHTHAHVLAELKAYGPLVTPGSYCVVFDTLIEDRPAGFFAGRPWGKGNNPKTAVWEFLLAHPEFEIDRSIPDKLQITVAPDGYMKRKS
jgi:cephalosporin hydroxylase